MARHLDAIIIGAGQAGPALAGRLTAAGMTVGLAERHLFGGTCVNTGCIPTKTLVASAAVAHAARRAADYGVHVAGPVTVDMARVHARAAKVSADARLGVERLLRTMDRLTVWTEHARLEDARTVRVGSETVTAARIFLNVGGRARVPALPGIDRVPFLTNTAMVGLATLPRHLVVVGGSSIGLEFAQMFRRFGSEVTVVERGPRLIGREAADTSAAVQGILEAEGITIRVAANCLRLGPHEAGVAVGVECATGAPEVIGSHVLLAVGRQPNTDDLGLDRAGVATDEHGFIPVDDQLATNVPGIWALGDCNGRGGFTHTAYNDFEIVAANLLDGAARRLSDRVPASALYIDPPLGRAGLDVHEARAGGRRILVGERPMTRVGRVVEKGETQGFMRLVVDADTDAILGGTILGPGGDEAIHSVVDLIARHATAADLRQIMHIHPTVAELLPTLAGALAPPAE